MLNPFTVCSLCQCQFVVWVLLTRKRTEVIRLERTKRTCPSKELSCRVSITRPLELSLSYYCFGKSWRALAIRPAHVLSSWRSCQWKWNVTARTADPSATLLKNCNRVQSISVDYRTCLKLFDPLLGAPYKDDLRQYENESPDQLLWHTGKT